MVKKVEPAEGAQFVRYFGPVLDALRELGGSGAPSEVIERIVENLKIPDSVQNELLDSGNPRFPNQVAWARYYLTREGLIDSSERGIWSLTEKGLDPPHVSAGPRDFSQVGEVLRRGQKEEESGSPARRGRRAGARKDGADSDNIPR